MTLTQIGSNQSEIHLNTGYSVLFSYKTPVAYCDAHGNYFKTSKKWSKTTSKHINQWLNGAQAKEVDQEVLDNLLK